MVAKLNRLSARGVDALLKRPGEYADGGNLYLVVSKSGSASWLFQFRWRGRQREMGLGSFTKVALADARKLADDARRALGAGRDPILLKRQAKRATFGEVADAHVESMETAWRNEKHRAQWRMTLKVYAAPLRATPVDEITTEDVLQVLKPIWISKPETASRLRGRIESVLDGAKAKGLRDGENPARWRGHLQNVLPKPRKLARGHHAAMPYPEVPPFLNKLRATRGTAALALEFAILTAARTGEVLGARWAETNGTENLWTVPAARMKSKREHRVPLCARAVELLARAKELGSSSYVFPGMKRDKPLSNMAFDMLLRRANLDVTAHGFRSSFRDWAAEETAFPREIAEMALAHLVGDETERAYRRGDALQKRRELMDAWAAFCNGTPKAPETTPDD